ncbi:MAG: TonB-dependent receptor [Steroidobacteraceae bacterium]|nr:TonB-dependent receptor [Steroidobacteraceae bacterium]
MIDSGETRLGQPAESGRPDYTFVQRTLDGVRQQIFGVAYEGRWLHRGEFGFGLQWTDYEKEVAQPGLPVARTSSRPWLYNATVAVTPTQRIAIYASFTRGLEESGVAPESAVNRNQALSAIPTRQADMGIRLALRPSLKLIAGLFDVRKPYVGLDADGWYREIGNVVHRGAEISLAGAITPRLDVAAGAVLQKPRVDAHDEGLERPDLRPVDQPERVLQLNADWRPARAGPWSFDTTITYRSVAVATTGNDVELPARTLVEVGARYRFAIGHSSAMLRLNVENLFDVFGFESRGSGAYDVLPGRLASAYVTVDW